MVRFKHDEAKVYMTQVFKQIQKLRDEEDGAYKSSIHTQQMPSIDFRMHTSRLLLELQEYKKTVKILDGIIQEEDE